MKLFTYLKKRWECFKWNHIFDDARHQLVGYLIMNGVALSEGVY